MARSEVALAELSAEIDLEPNALIKFLDQLIGTNFISALYSLETGRLYSLAALLEKQRQMLAVIQARGRLNLFDLAKELNVPASYIRQWLGSLTNLNKFSGFIDWKNQSGYLPAALYPHRKTQLPKLWRGSYPGRAGC